MSIGLTICWALQRGGRLHKEAQFYSQRCALPVPHPVVAEVQHLQGGEVAHVRRLNAVNVSVRQLCSHHMLRQILIACLEHHEPCIAQTKQHDVKTSAAQVQATGLLFVTLQQASRG